MATRARQPVEEEESYFISMTDLMVGLLFVFIIMLMFFALQYREATRQKEEVTDKLVNAEQVRDQILEDLQKRLSERHIIVEIVKDQGILRLPEGILFEKSKAEISHDGENAVAALGDALMAVLPCYSFGERGTVAEGCPERRATIESLYIEGHTDVDRLNPRPGMQDNLDLSAIRATNTYRLLINKQPRLLGFMNKNHFPVLSVSGYGEHRPVKLDQLTETDKSRNRRIDLRILMSTPRSEDAQKFETEMQDVMGHKQ